MDIIFNLCLHHEELHFVYSVPSLSHYFRLSIVPSNVKTTSLSNKCLGHCSTEFVSSKRQISSHDIDFTFHSLPDLNVTAPTPPLGFSTSLNVKPSIQLKPLDVYICTIELMSLLSALSWDFILPGLVTVASESLVLTIHPVESPATNESVLPAEYAVLGLYQVGVAIAQGNQFYQLDATISIDSSMVGWFEYRSYTGAPQQSPNSSLQRLSPRIGSEVSQLYADSGRIFDPDEKNFLLTYQWDGLVIKSQDIFTVLLDGFAIAAKHNGSHLDAHIPAARSASGDIVLSTWTVGDKADPDMSWGRLKRALLLIWDFLILGYRGRKARFGGFMFELQYKGKNIGAGRLLKFDTGNVSIGATAVDK